MEEATAPRMITLGLPDDPDLLRAVGVVALRHSHLDHMLRMMFKSLSGVSVREALNATARTTAGELRNRVGKLARRRLGEGAALIKVQDLLTRCEHASERRNRLIHDIWAQNADGEGTVMTPRHEWGPLPTVQELDEAAADLANLAAEINHARLKGFLFEALSKK